MPDESDVNIKLTEEFATEQAHYGIASEFGDSEEFNEFIDKVLASAEDGTPVAHIISHIVMELFQPAFVMVGSPRTRKTAEGYNMPQSLGVAIGGNSELTRTDLVILLREFATQLENASNPESLFNE